MEIIRFARQGFAIHAMDVSICPIGVPKIANRKALGKYQKRFVFLGIISVNILL